MLARANSQKFALVKPFRRKALLACKESPLLNLRSFRAEVKGVVFPAVLVCDCAYLLLIDIRLVGQLLPSLAKEASLVFFSKLLLDGAAQRR